ncbi:hypothetical protein E3T37_16155 [Cryobacterium sp. TMT2-10]|nr:hypothetical protein E3T37_16155 [Cryobacterium sp. TMT2-10]
MIVSDPYPDGRAVLSAITEKARAAHRSGVGSSVQSLIELAVFDRFLCRVFSLDDCPFALKGGTSMLARLPQSRSTTDVDLETAEMSIDAAIAQLASAASIDLGDHFEFRYVSHRDTGGPNQPELHAASITFSVTVRGAGTRNPLRVDLAIHTRTPCRTPGHPYSSIPARHVAPGTGRGLPGHRGRRPDRRQGVRDPIDLPRPGLHPNERSRRSGHPHKNNANRCTPTPHQRPHRSAPTWPAAVHHAPRATLHDRRIPQSCQDRSCLERRPRP